MYRAVLFFALLASLRAAGQDVYLSAGPGVGVFSNGWKRAAPVWTGGIVIDNRIGERTGTMIGLSYRQRATTFERTRLHLVQFDVSGYFAPGRFAFGAGGFFALCAGSTSDAEPPVKYSSGVGVTGFAQFRISNRLRVRATYDHGLGNISEIPGRTVTAQAGYICILFRV